MDPRLSERIRASLAGSPFYFLDSEEPLPPPEVDLYVAPARAGGKAAVPVVAEQTAAARPLILCGPAALLRAAFLSGAADYLREPWTPEELALRAEAVLQRNGPRIPLPGNGLWMETGVLGSAAGTVPLSFHEAAVLRILLRGAGAPVPREAIAYALWGRPCRPGSRAVDAHVAALRRKIARAAAGAGPEILAVRGRGYLVRQPTLHTPGTQW
jgi:hypothetical protein